MLAVYVSGHGFGHATRTAEVLRVVRERAPDLPIAIGTSAPAGLFESVVAPPLELRAVVADVGLAQKDALTIDEDATVSEWRAFMSGWPALVDAEARWLKAAGARLVLGDIPPLAFAAAEAAGVPSVALGNFSWDWIYAHLARRVTPLAGAAVWAARAYRRAGLLLRLPFAGDLSAFPRVKDVPLVVRTPTLARSEARRRLGLGERPVVLLSFGGAGLSGLELSAYEGLGDYEILVTGVWTTVAAAGNTRVLAADALDGLGLSYPDLVGAADVVVTKPGYGIVTDCIGAGTRLVYTDRGDFPEYEILVREMPSWLPVEFASNAQVREGRLGPALAAVRQRAFPERRRTDGAAVVAETLLAWL